MTTGNAENNGQSVCLLRLFRRWYVNCTRDVTSRKDDEEDVVYFKVLSWRIPTGIVNEAIKRQGTWPLHENRHLQDINPYTMALVRRACLRVYQCLMDVLQRNGGISRNKTKTDKASDDDKTTTALLSLHRTNMHTNNKIQTRSRNVWPVQDSTSHKKTTKRVSVLWTRHKASALQHTACKIYKA